jgi:acyl carrier protein
MTALEIIREEVGPAVQMDDRLDSLGLDSLDLLQLLVRIQDEHEMDIPPAALASLQTVGDIVRCVREARLAAV